MESINLLCSIKAFLPAVLGENPYKALHIQKGDIASNTYFKLYHSEQGVEDEDEVRENLLKYCELDTLAMVMIVRGLVK